MTTTASPRPMPRPVEHLVHRRDLPADVDLDAPRRLAGRASGPPTTCARDAAQVRARDVGRQAHLPPHVVAVDTGRASCRAGHRGHVAHAGPGPAPVRLTGIGSRSAIEPTA